MINNVGLYGKLPAHGDFITRDLPPAFINIWDEWLQRGMLCSQEELGDNWLDIYLTSPIWRFAISTGAIDDNNWAGIMIPSVDRVGRYFPFTLVAKLSSGSNAFEMISSEGSWYRNLENIALEGLDGHLDVDEMHTELQSVQGLNQSIMTTTNKSVQAVSGHISISMDFEEQLPSSVYPGLLEYLLKKDGQSYSVWHSLGSDLVKPCFLLSKGLPPARGLTALIDGNWEQHNWFVPFAAKQDLISTNDELIPDEVF